MVDAEVDESVGAGTGNGWSSLSSPEIIFSALTVLFISKNGQWSGDRVELPWMWDRLLPSEY